MVYAQVYTEAGIPKNGGNASGATYPKSTHFHLQCIGRTKGFYRDWALAAFMVYDHVYTETGIPRIWGNFKCPRNVLTTAKNCWKG